MLEPACVTVTVWLLTPEPDTVTVAVLEPALLFAVWLMVNKPLLLPEPPEIVNQLMDSDAVQLTLEETAIDVFPAELVGLILLGETVKKLVTVAPACVTVIV